jgi:hypothetical protein
MTDLERRLEDLFTHDSRSRRVIGVDMPARRRNQPLVLVGATALAVVALIAALNTVAFRENAPLTSPATSASPAATPGTDAVVRCGETTRFVAPTADSTGSFVLVSDGRADLVRVPAGSGLVAAGGYNCARIKPGTPSSELVEFLPMNSPEYVPHPSATARPFPIRTP